MKIDLYCQRQRCSLVTLVSVNIKFVPIFEGVHWREGVKRQWGNRKHGFSRLSTLRLQLAKKWDERYCILLLNQLSPFHWSRNRPRPLYDLGWLWLAWMFIIRYSIGCGQCLHPRMLSDFFQFHIHSAFASFRTWPKSRVKWRNQRNPVENVTKCYLIKKF